MADNLDDGEFWLPPQFLSDDDFTAAPFAPKDTLSHPNNGEDSILFPSEFPHGFASSSDFSSPVDSLVGGSSETESDEEEQLVAELTRRLARSNFQVDFKSPDNNMGRRFVSGSPQSTLCAFGSKCGCRKGSSQGSPNGVCSLSSAKATWDLLHAAAGEVERMRLSQGSCYGYNNGLFVPQREPSPLTVPSKNNTATNTNSDFYTPQSLSHQQLQVAQLQMLRQQQMSKQQNSVWGVQKQCGGGVYQQRQTNNQIPPTRGRNSDVNSVEGRNTRPLGLSPSAWPTLQHAKNQPQQNQQYSSGPMRAVFLENPSKCAGTGVFLPRRVDSPAELRKKPACATAFVPARVAQALNLNLDDYTMVVGCQPQQHLNRFNASSNIENAAVPRVRSNYVLSQQKRDNFSRPQPAVNNEIRLPQEWTY